MTSDKFMEQKFRNSTSKSNLLKFYNGLRPNKNPRDNSFPLAND